MERRGDDGPGPLRVGGDARGGPTARIRPCRALTVLMPSACDAVDPAEPGDIRICVTTDLGDVDHPSRGIMAATARAARAAPGTGVDVVASLLTSEVEQTLLEARRDREGARFGARSPQNT